MQEEASQIPSEETPEEPLFNAVLHPHRSLSPTGFMILMTGVSLASFGAGIAFVIAGAWPVMGFFGLDVALIYVAFRVNYRWGRIYETLLLTEDTLTVERVLPNGKTRRWRFQPYWLKISIDDPPRHDSGLILSSHGKSLVIGAFLTLEERLEVAQALAEALAKLRQTPLPQTD